MKRRAFIVALGGAAASSVSWPLTARAQQPAVIGFIHSGSPAPYGPHLAAFRQGLGEAGYVEGQNLTIEYRWAEGNFDRLPAIIADLVQRQVAVIATPDSVAAMVTKGATAAIPIVFGVADDPVKLGLVASLARPGGNATGINFFLAELVAKRLGLLRELMPGAVRLAVLVNPANAANAQTTIREAERVAGAAGLQLQILQARSNQEIHAAFATLARERADALFVGPDSFFNSRRVQLTTLATKYAIPAAYAARDYAEVGGLMSYGTSVPGMFRQVGAYTGRVLKGEKPADLPVVQPTKFELVINLTTAKALGLEVPATLLARADEVIE
jgi:putative ABC transport system substrate-binding protein